MLQCGNVEETHNGALGYVVMAVVKVLELKLLEGRKDSLV